MQPDLTGQTLEFYSMLTDARPGRGPPQLYDFGTILCSPKALSYTSRRGPNDVSRRDLETPSSALLGRLAFSPEDEKQTLV